MTPQLSQSVYDLVVNEFKKLNDVNADGFYVISALALGSS